MEVPLQVLTMEYCPGIKVNRIDELDRLGVDRKLLARQASKPGPKFCLLEHDCLAEGIDFKGEWDLKRC